MKLISRRNKSYRHLWCFRRASDVHTVIWILILTTLFGSLVINITLERQTESLREIIKTAQGNYNDQKTEPTIETLILQPFDPLKITIDTKRDKEKYEEIIKTKIEAQKQQQKAQTKKKSEYLLYWYNPPPYLKLRNDSLYVGFSSCQYKNCRMTFDRKDAQRSDAVLFDGRWVWEKLFFKRPQGQIWIFAAHEAPVTFEDLGGWWTKPNWRSSFNWTMTYDATNTDIFLPYGKLEKHSKPVVRDFKSIASRKTKGALMINSHCPTLSIREEYVKRLQKYIDVTVLGKCGTPWNCGTHYVHDNCFDILNTTYKFFLAFENAFCNQYFSEKIFENFNYDIINIVRGGSFGEAKKVLPKGTFISTDDFRTIEGLGKYLQKLSWSLDSYANMLKEKSQYYSPGYKAVYQKAMCDLCERMNHQDKYRKTIPNIVHWAYSKNPCRNASDII